MWNLSWQGEVGRPLWECGLSHVISLLPRPERFTHDQFHLGTLEDEEVCVFFLNLISPRLQDRWVFVLWTHNDRGHHHWQRHVCQLDLFHLLMEAFLSLSTLCCFLRYRNGMSTWTIWDEPVHWLSPPLINQPIFFSSCLTPPSQSFYLCLLQFP